MDATIVAQLAIKDNFKNNKMTAQEIKKEINDHLAKNNKQYYSDFYIGITNDIERRLFGEHNVPRKGHWRIHRVANSESHARVVEKHFLDEGMKGGTGGGNADCVYVYCYEISDQTVE
ncbi:hypothetical protein LJC57_02250 [Parabacteroides sp. OttesenSCG-928-G07]|nr:hypothetical protein [Parabacteroides sp. OttesenSCG-928-G07]